MVDFDKYGIKVIYKQSVDDEVWYEETVLLIKSGSSGQAYERAQKYAQCVISSLSGNTNHEGKPIKYELCEITEVYGIYDIDEDNGVIEVYSRLTPNDTGLSEKDYIRALCRNE